MERTAKLFVLIFVTVLFAGCFDDQDSIPEYDISEMTKDIVAQEESTVKQPSAEFSDLIKSIELKEKIECDYKAIDEDTKEALKAKIYVEGDTYKSITWKNDEELYSIFDGEVFYNWSNLSKDGFMMANSCVEEFEGSVPEIDGDGDVDLDTYKTSSELFDEKVSMNCKEGSFVGFSIPDDINFVDQCELLKQQREAIKKINAE